MRPGGRIGSALLRASTSVSVALAIACAGSSQDPRDGGPADGAGRSDTGPPSDGGPEPLPRACPAIFEQDVLPTFEIQIDPAEWQGLYLDQALREERLAAGEDPNPYHPLLAFRWGQAASGDAMIRLKGNSTWYEAKLQFVISFNENDPDGRFLGLRKIVLDASSENASFLRDRLALHHLRDLGVPAPCANNARLVVNGDYYGLYSNIERIDRELLERNFADPDGNLYRAGHELVTNEDVGDTSDLAALRAAVDPAAIDALVDLDEALLEWAGEAVIPQGDGYWAGRANYYLYHQPAGDWVWLPWDLDTCFDSVPEDAHPIDYLAKREVKYQHFAAIVADPVWRQRYVDAVAAAAAGYDAVVLQARIDAWFVQIADDAAADPSKTFTTDHHLDSVEELRAFVAERDAFLDDWIDCMRNGGPDADGDGRPWCDDCDEISCER
jgi:hypothetical protein